MTKHPWPRGTKVRFNKAFWKDSVFSNRNARITKEGEYTIVSFYQIGSDLSFAYRLEELELTWHENWLEEVNFYCNCRRDYSFTPSCLDCVLKYYP